MTIRLTGSTSGYTEVAAPAVAGSNTLVLPGGNGTADQALVTNGSGTLSFADRGRMVLETAKSATGTEVDFTGIPSWVKRVTVMFNAVSTNGTSNILIQLGTSSGVATSGYASTATVPNGSVIVDSSTGLIVTANDAASSVRRGLVMISTMGSSNVWCSIGGLGDGAGAHRDSAGTATLSSTLDRVRITTVNGTDEFDAGSINLLLEG